MSNQLFDVAVVGAGPVGALTALLANKQGLSVLLLDAQPVAAELSPDAPVDLRVVALAPGSRRLLESVHAWPKDALATRIQAYQRMQVWDANGPGRIEFSAADHKLSSLGDIVEVPVLQAGLNLALASSGVQRWSAASLHSLGWGTDGQRELITADGRRAQARLLIGSDGRESAVRKTCGIAVEQRDYRQAGIVAVLELDDPHQNCARQAFTDIGPLGLLPLPGNKVSIVWSVPVDQVSALLNCEEEDFLQRLRAASGVGFAQLCSKRVQFPLRLQHAQSYIDEAVALLGDAAHVVHPLAGLGMNLGFEDAASLLRHLKSAKVCRSARALEAALQGYQRERRIAVNLAIQTIDGLDQLFNSRHAEMIRLRDTGLNLVDRLAPVKTGFMRYALGAAA